MPKQKNPFHRTKRPISRKFRFSTELDELLRRMKRHEGSSKSYSDLIHQAVGNYVLKEYYKADHKMIDLAKTVITIENKYH